MATNNINIMLVEDSKSNRGRYHQVWVGLERPVTDRDVMWAIGEYVAERFVGVNALEFQPRYVIGVKSDEAGRIWWVDTEFGAFEVGYAEAEPEDDYKELLASGFEFIEEYLETYVDEDGHEHIGCFVGTAQEAEAREIWLKEHGFECVSLEPLNWFNEEQA